MIRSKGGCLRGKSPAGIASTHSDPHTRNLGYRLTLGLRTRPLGLLSTGGCRDGLRDVLGGVRVWEGFETCATAGTPNTEKGRHAALV